MLCYLLSFSSSETIMTCITFLPLRKRERGERERERGREREREREKERERERDDRQTDKTYWCPSIARWTFFTFLSSRALQ